MLDNTLFITDKVEEVFKYKNRSVHTDASYQEMKLFCPECKSGPFEGLK